MSEPISDDRLRNTRAWADARIGQLSGAEVIVAACDEALASRDKLGTIEQALMEVRHAQECGAEWYTKGKLGLYQQVAMWVRRGFEAVDSIKAAREHGSADNGDAVRD